MAVRHETVLYDVNDAKVYALTDDSGASPTYGAGIDVPGIGQVGWNPNLVTAELKGDARVIARKGKVDKFPITATYGRLSMEVLVAILGGEIVDAVANARYRYRAQTNLPPFGFAAQIQDTDSGLGCVHLLVYKAQLTGGTLMSQASDQFGQPSFQAEGYAVDCSSAGWLNMMAELVYYSTVVALPANLGTPV